MQCGPPTGLSKHKGAGFVFTRWAVLVAKRGHQGQNGRLQGALLKKEQKAFIVTNPPGSGVKNENSMRRSKCLENFGHNLLYYEIKIKIFN